MFKYKNKQDTVIYIHNAAFRPIESTWIQAISACRFTSLPGFTPEIVRKHLDKKLVTIKVHIEKFWQNLRITSNKLSITNLTTTITPHVMTISTIDKDVCENLVIFKSINIVRMISSNQTDYFKITSNKWNKYIMVMHNNDVNVILYIQ